MYVVLLISIFVLLIMAILCYLVLSKQTVIAFSKKVILSGILIALFLSAIFPVYQVMTRTFHTDIVTIRTIPEVNESGEIRSETALCDVKANKWTNHIVEPIEGKWAWTGEYYHWNQYISDKTGNLTKEIKIPIPIGKDRELLFVTDPFSGYVEVEYNGKIERRSLYSDQYGRAVIIIEDSAEESILYDAFQRIALITVLSVVIFCICFLLIYIIGKTPLYSYVCRFRRETEIFLLFLIKIVLYGRYPGSLDYTNSYYFMNYEGGFSSRAILGEMINRFFGPYISSNALSNIKLVCLLSFYAFLSIVLVRVARILQDQKVAVFLVELIILSPFLSIEIIDDVRVDLFINLIFIICMILINKDRFLALVPPLCALMMLNNESSCVFYIASICLMCIYLAFVKKQRTYFTCGITSFLITSLLAIYYFVLGKTGLMDPTEAYLHGILHTDSITNWAAYHAEGLSIGMHLDSASFNFGEQLYDFALLKQSFVGWLILLPYLLLIVMLWRALFIHLSLDGDKSFRIIYLILPLSGFGAVLCMIIGFDYFRFFSFVFICSLSLIVSLAYQTNTRIELRDIRLFRIDKESSNENGGYVRFPILVLLYSAVIGQLDVWTNTSPIVVRTISIIDSITR